jgi:hypothetical protein
MSAYLGRRWGAVVLPVAACLVWGLLPGPSAQAKLIGHWTFNDDTCNDSTTNANHGVPQGGFTYVDVNGNPDNRGISLDGDNHAVGPDDGSGIRFGSPPEFNITTQDFSIAAWVAIDTTAGNGGQETVFGKLGGQYFISYEESGRRFKGLFNGAVLRETDVGAADPRLSWHHVLMVKSTTKEFKIFLDGVCVTCHLPSTIGASPNDSSAHDLTAGFGGGNAMVAIYDELAFYDTYLQASEVLEIYNAGPTFTPSVESSTIVFDDAFGTEFISEAGVTYVLESTTNLVTSNGWSSTGAFAAGNGTNMFLFDSSGFSTAKLYRVSIAP